VCVNISFAGRTDLLVPTPINFRLSCSSEIQRKMVMKNVNRRQLSTSESDNSSVCRLFHTQARTHTERYFFLSLGLGCETELGEKYQRQELWAAEMMMDLATMYDRQLIISANEPPEGTCLRHRDARTIRYDTRISNVRSKTDR